MGLSADKVDTDTKKTIYKKLGLKSQREDNEADYAFEKVESKKRAKKIVVDAGQQSLASLKESQLMATLGQGMD